MWPFTKKAAPAVETKSLAEPDAELLAILGATVNGTAAVSTSTALTVPAVSAAIRVISEAVATLEVKVQRKDGDTWVDDEEHPACPLLRGFASPWLSGFETIRDLVSESLTRDFGGLAWVNRIDGKPAEIIHYRQAIISVQYAPDTGEPTYRLSGQVVPTRDIIHLTGPFGRCPLNLAAEAIGVAWQMEKYAARLFTNGARPAGVLQFPAGVKLGDSALAKIKAGWNAAFGGSGNGAGTAITWDGAEWKPLSFSSVDSQFLELRKFQVDEIARAFRVPPSMIYSLDRATWSNSEQMGREFLTYCLEPHLRALEAALTRALIDPGDRRTFRIWFERDDLTRADIGQRATAYSSLITSRVINPNEARKWEGLPSYAEGNAFANPNVTPAKPANDNNPPIAQQQAA
ncbi:MULTISPECIES: phage portal protein [unclassified Mesorhizobium]|uniref:phage portal protein n=1 Tax=unclassified Mesorhizobium TaxID=325217 RepID=UPI00109331CB|nr:MULTISPECIES: phage portal protein [unclassified Mesorhizobium]TGP88924.1 phage portal protein [Mesorhizobium sp. M8A.F.Ca.ET.218.01.1.1]TGT16084.1 phage portal protein [Mesorhizobium sp. M8A.F.Ca.ET.213.01.1.1]